MDWKIYYCDGSTFSSEQGGAMDAPMEPIAVVLVRDGRFGRRKLFLNDYYMFRPSLNRWTEHFDAASLIMAACSEEIVVVRRGGYMREDDFERILIKADNDPDFPVKAAGPPHKAWKRD